MSQFDLHFNIHEDLIEVVIIKQLLCLFFYRHVYIISLHSCSKAMTHYMHIFVFGDNRYRSNIQFGHNSFYSNLSKMHSELLQYLHHNLSLRNIVYRKWNINRERKKKYSKQKLPAATVNKTTKNTANTLKFILNWCVKWSSQLTMFHSHFTRPFILNAIQFLKHIYSNFILIYSNLDWCINQRIHLNKKNFIFILLCVENDAYKKYVYNFSESSCYVGDSKIWKSWFHNCFLRHKQRIVGCKLLLIVLLWKQIWHLIM